MTFWEFLDRQFSRVRADGVAGAGIFILTGVILWIIVNRPELADNDLFKTISQAIIVQGLIGLAMAAWFTKKSREQEVVEIKQPKGKPIPTHEVDDEKEEEYAQ